MSSTLNNTLSGSTDSNLTTTSEPNHLHADANPLKSQLQQQTPRHPQPIRQKTHSAELDPLLQADTATTNSSALKSAPSFLDIPPDLRIIDAKSYEQMSWKNGLGTTYQIAIHPSQKDYKREEFHWRLARSDIVDSCSMSVFPGYDIHMILLPEEGANVMIKGGSKRSPIVLHHNGEETPVNLKALVPYVYRGEMPTSCIVHSSPLRYLSFIANREATEVNRLLFFFGGFFLLAWTSEKESFLTELWGSLDLRQLGNHLLTR
jgi:environmental stress-induced protein Ves